MVNPFIVYILAFGGTLLAYGFDWSTLYPRLSGDVVSFFIWTFLAALPLAAVVWPRLACVRRRKSALPGWMTKAMVVGMIADIAYAGGIPLFMVAAGSDFDYSQFGIPTFHVILVTFSSAYAAVRFSDFLISRRTRYLVDALIPLAFSVLTFTRGTAMMSLIAFGFIWLSHHGMPRLRSMIVGVVLGIGALYAFGVLGDIRSPGAIEEVGQPSSAFKSRLCQRPICGRTFTSRRRWQTCRTRWMPVSAPMGAPCNSRPPSWCPTSSASGSWKRWTFRARMWPGSRRR